MLFSTPQTKPRIRAESYSIGDLVVIPKNHSYRDAGEMKMLAIAVPQFDPESVKFLE